MAANNSTAPKYEFIPRTTGEHGERTMHFNFQNEPRTRKSSNIYRFYYQYKDPLTGKEKRSSISTHETDSRRANAKREKLREEVLSKIYSNEIRHSDKQPIGDYF